MRERIPDLNNSGAKMTDFQCNYISDVNKVVGIEDQLAAVLTKAAREVQHIEFNDQEQRAEVYTILRALQDDTAAHRRLVGRWVSDSERN